MRCAWIYLLNGLKKTKNTTTAINDDDDDDDIAEAHIPQAFRFI